MKAGLGEASAASEEAEAGLEELVAPQRWPAGPRDRGSNLRSPALCPGSQGWGRGGTACLPRSPGPPGRRGRLAHSALLGRAQGHLQAGGERSCHAGCKQPQGQVSRGQSDEHRGVRPPALQLREQMGPPSPKGRVLQIQNILRPSYTPSKAQALFKNCFL